MKHIVELTDTFGGQANYSWVHRHTLDDTDRLTERALVRRAKALVGLNGVPGKGVWVGETYEFRPYGAAWVMFIYLDDSND